jgi:cell division septum initiation protein DivIVA
MTDREIRHLSKTELLTIIRDQEQELQQAKQQQEELKRRLAEKKTNLEKCGSIAEASLQVNQVFQAAQAAADQYLSEMREKREGIDAESGRILAEAKQKADAQVRLSMETGRKIEEESRRKADSYWTELQGKLEAFYQSRQGLEQMLASCGMKIQVPDTGVKRENDTSKGSAPKP